MDSGSVEGRRRCLGRGGRGLAVVGALAVVVGFLIVPPAPVHPLVAYATAAGGGGGSGNRAPLLNLTLNLTDSPAYTPPYLLVPAPSRLNLTLVNRGVLNHTFTLMTRPNFVVNRSWTPSELDHFLSVNGSQANVTVPGNHSASISLNFTAVQAGFSYEFLSAIPYQFQAGMFGFLNVTGPPSGPGLVANVSADAAATLWLPSAIGINTSSFPVTVDMAISNQGSNSHTFWIEGQPNYSLNSGNFSSYFQAHPPLASLTIPTSQGQVVWANFTIAHPGIYEYICTIPGHFAGGMYGYLYVGVPVPATPVPPSTDIVQPWVLYGGVSLLGVGAVLAGAALLVGRFPRLPRGGHGH